MLSVRWHPKAESAHRQQASRSAGLSIPNRYVIIRMSSYSLLQRSTIQLLRFPFSFFPAAGVPVCSGPGARCQVLTMPWLIFLISCIYWCIPPAMVTIPIWIVMKAVLGDQKSPATHPAIIPRQCRDGCTGGTAQPWSISPLLMRWVLWPIYLASGAYRLPWHPLKKVSGGWGTSRSIVFQGAVTFLWSTTAAASTKRWIVPPNRYVSPLQFTYWRILPAHADLSA